MCKADFVINNSSIYIALLMLYLTIALLCIRESTSASTPPLLSNLGDVFRSGGVTVSIGNQSTYDFNVPYPEALSSNAITLALAMPSYSQTFDATYKIDFRLSEDTPSASTSTNAVFRAYFGFYSRTTVAKIQYLVCFTSVLSQNFSITVLQLSPGILYPSPMVPNSYYYNLTSVLNTTGGIAYSVWMSGLKVSKPASGDFISIYAYFISSLNQLCVLNWGSNNMIYESLKITFVFINWQGIVISGSYRLPYTRGFSNSFSFPYSIASFNSWFDTSNIICSPFYLYTDTNFYDYAVTYLGNKVSFTTLIPSGNWISVRCLIAGPKMCPTTHPYYDRSTNLCHDVCTGQNTNDYLCTPAYTCPANCKYCSSNTVCKVCYQTYYLRFDSLCYSSCLNGTFPNITAMTCDSCPSGCNSCTSGTACTTCSYGFYLRSDNLCYSTCLNGFYPESSNLTCTSCPLGCDTCTSLTTCQTCSPSNYLRANNLCYSTCLSGFYAEPSNLTCTSCPLGCDTCTSLAACQACSSGFYLRSDSLCYSTCLPGLYPELSNLTCTTCPLGCDTCTSLVSCQICSPAFYLRTDGLCYSTCFEGYFADNFTQTCVKCPIGCAACTSLIVCSACLQSYELTNQLCSQVESSDLKFIIGWVVVGVTFCLVISIVVLALKKGNRNKTQNTAISNETIVSITETDQSKKKPSKSVTFDDSQIIHLE